MTERKNSRPDLQKPFVERFAEWIMYGSRWSKVLAQVVAFVAFCAVSMVPRRLGLNQYLADSLSSALVSGFCALLMVFIYLLLKRGMQRMLLRYQTDARLLRGLSWQHLEMLCAELFGRMGWSVKDKAWDKPAADGGVDLVMQREGERAIVQCKCWQVDQVGVEKVRELYGLLDDWKAQRAIFVTTTSFTDAAEQFAYNKPMELIDFGQLWDMVEKTNSEGRLHELADKPTKVLREGDACPKCDGRLVLRPSKRGPMLGCSNYAKLGCRVIVDVESGKVKGVGR